MQPYVNPSYFQYGNYQQQQPYQPNYQNYQSRFVTQQEQRPMMCGGLVDDFGLITANDVPMDGSPAVFVKKDGKEIELRQWGSDGQIRRTVYMPKIDDLEKETKESTPDYMQALNDRLDAFEKAFDSRFSKMERALKKKEVVENE